MPDFDAAAPRRRAGRSGGPAARPDRGLVRLRHDDASTCSYQGTAYGVDGNGEFRVPAAAVAALAAHGFVPAAAEKE